MRNGRHPLLFSALLHALLFAAGCGLFEPRDPEPPGQSSLDFRPPLDPSIVVANLQSAIDQKSSANYASCFSDPATGGRRFVFLPSAEAAAQYGPAFTDWGNAEELAYFQNLISRSTPNANAQLLLVMTASVVTGDSVVYSFDYTFRFEHNDPGVAQTARGNLQFTIAPDAANRWSIHRWADFKTGEDISWSVIKGRFSN